MCTVPIQFISVSTQHAPPQAKVVETKLGCVWHDSGSSKNSFGSGFLGGAVSLVEPKPFSKSVW